ncbi:hypothetical protein S83_070352, partial [Arachis hypogaea]
IIVNYLAAAVTGGSCRHYLEAAAKSPPKLRTGAENRFVAAGTTIGAAVQLMLLTGSLRYKPPLMELLYLVIPASCDIE